MFFIEQGQWSKLTMTTFIRLLTTRVLCNLKSTGLRLLSTSFSESCFNFKSCAEAWLLVTLRWELVRFSELTELLLVVWYSHCNESVSPFQLTLGQWGRRTVAKFQTQKINGILWIRFRCCKESASIEMGRRATVYKRNPTTFLTRVWANESGTHVPCIRSTNH